MAKEIIKTNLKLSDKILLKYNDRDVDMSLSDFKTFLDANLEPSSAVLTPSEPLKYKALISQDEPIDNQTYFTITFKAGATYTLSGTDGNFYSSHHEYLEKLSGDFFQDNPAEYDLVGSVFLCLETIEYVVPDGIYFSHDGAIYIVSKDENGNFNPYTNTTTVEPTFTYNSEGDNIITMVGLFVDKSKVSHSIQNTTPGAHVTSVVITNDDMGISTLDNTGTPADDILNYTPFEIEVYP